MRKSWYAIAAAAALAGGSTATAAPTITYNTGNNSGFTASFSNPSPAAEFDDLFEPFNVSVWGVLNLTLTTIGIHPMNDVDFTFARINGPGQPINVDITKSSVSTPPGATPQLTNPDGLEFGLISGQPIGPGLYQLQIKGMGPGSTGNGSYSGTLAFAAAAGAVPEPSTWALMILGFGAIGFAMRRQRSRMPAVSHGREAYC